MLEKDDKKEILENNKFLNERKESQKKSKIQKHKNVMFILAMFFSIAIITTLYLLSPYSKTYHVAVKGNIYLSDEDIIKEADLNDYFLFTFPRYKEDKLKENPFIEDCSIKMLKGNIVSIEVKEVKAIGYINEENQPKLLLINDVRIPLDANNMYLINSVPLIQGYNQEELLTIEKGFKELDSSLINEISEIHKYSMSYDKMYMNVVMRDGNDCFMSYNDLWLLKNYYQVLSLTDTSLGHACFYFDELAGFGYAGACPWQSEENKQ